MPSLLPPSVVVDGSTLQSVNGVISIKDLGVTGPKLSTVQKVRHIIGGMTVSAASTEYAHPVGFTAGFPTEGGARGWRVGTAGTIQVFRSRLQDTLGVAETLVVTVRINGVDSVLSVTHPNSAAGGTIQSVGTAVAVVAGDLITIEVASTDLAINGVSWTLEYLPAG